jgi:hypothetical protein
MIDRRAFAAGGFENRKAFPILSVGTLARFSGEMDTGPRKENASNMRECKSHLRLWDRVLPQRTNLI